MRAKWIGLTIVVVGAAAAAGVYYMVQPSGPPANQPTWEHTYGGPGRDEATHATPTEDGGVVVAGDRTPDGKSDADAWVIRLDKAGSTVWERTWGSDGDEHVEDIQPTLDGGFIATGETQGATSGIGSVWVAKLDGKGSTVWLKQYDRKRKGRPHAILAAADGGYVVAGTEQSANPDYYDGWVAKIDADGKIVWERYYGGQDDETVNAIRATPDGGYVFAGTTQSKGAGGKDAWVVKINSTGQQLWEETFGSPENDSATDLVTLGDKGYVVAGWTESDRDRHKRDGWVIRLDAKGKKLWEHSYGGAENDEAHEIRPGNDSGFVVVGTTESKSAGGKDAWVLRIDDSGNELWNRTIGGKDDDEATAVVPMLDGAFVVVGKTRSQGAGGQDAWVMQLNALGEMTKSG
ncbi:MAG TPA: hypothetical protein VKB51_03600 [bacterium]|nr:hypothetical protein [bacterium]